MNEARFDAGRTIVFQGEAADCFYVLRSGSVEIVVNEARDLPIDDRKLARSGRVLAAVEEPGAVIGEMGVVLGTRAASLRAGPGGTVLEVVHATDESLGRAIDARPSLGVSLSRVLARRLADRTAELDRLIAAAEAGRDRLDVAVRRFADFARRIERVFSRRPEILFLARTIEGPKTFARAAGPAPGVRIRERFEPSVAPVSAGAAPEEVGSVLELAFGDVLYEKGATGTEFHVLIAGRLAIEVDGREIAFVEPGALVGAMGALLQEGARTETVRAVADSRVARVAAVHFGAVVERRPALAVGLIRALIAQLVAQGDHLARARVLAAELLEGLAAAEHDYSEFVRRCREGGGEFLTLGLDEFVAEAETIRAGCARVSAALAQA